MNILMISPQSPPKNSPESIQVGMYLEELDKNNKITLINTPAYGWTKNDSSLNKKLNNTKIITLKLPFHKISYRILSSKYFKSLHFPDSDFWIQSKKIKIINEINKNKFDIIYSRSTPFSSALLSLKLKEKTNLPWVMHLSDPWSDSPYKKYKSNDEKIKFQTLEKKCFSKADKIMLTTQSMANFYKNKYPEYKNKICISSNVMTNPLLESPINNLNNKLIYTYTGALYSERSPDTIIKAVNYIYEKFPLYKEKFEFLFYGNIAEEIKEKILNSNFKEIKIMGYKPFNEIKEIQMNSDILVTIEPDGDNPLLKTFMPSKLLDYLSLRKNILAITPQKSETWNLIGKGFGWNIEPNNYEKLAELIIKMIDNRNLDFTINNEILKNFTAKNNVQNLEKEFNKLIKEYNE